MNGKKVAIAAILCLLLASGIVMAGAGPDLVAVPLHASVSEGTINYSVSYSNYTPCNECIVTWSTNNSRGLIDANSGVMNIVKGEATTIEILAENSSLGIIQSAIVEVCDEIIGCGPISQPTTTTIPIVITRKIDKQSILPGETTLVTLTVNGDAERPFSLIEYVPDGWNVQIMSSSAFAYRLVPAENNVQAYYEWSWIREPYGGAVSYYITAPNNSEGAYVWLHGTIGDETGIIAIVSGERSVTVGIRGYYKGLGTYNYIVETTDLLKAAKDWQENITPPGFAVPITITELMELAEEWQHHYPQTFN